MNKQLAKAVAFHESGHYRSVLPITKRLLSANKKDDAALFYHAFALLGIGQFRRSLQYWERLKKISPTDLNLHLNMGVCYHELGKTSKANQCYKEELKSYPASKEALYNLGINYYYARRYRDAAHYLELCYSQKHRMDRIVCKLAQSYFKTNQADKEQSLYENYLMENPNDTWALNNLGSHLMGQGHYHRALLRLKKAARLDPKDKLVNRNILKVEKILGKLKAGG